MYYSISEDSFILVSSIDLRNGDIVIKPSSYYASGFYSVDVANKTFTLVGLPITNQYNSRFLMCSST